MINILISIGVGLALFIGLFFVSPLWVSIPIAIVSMAGCMFFLGKKVMNEINIIMTNSTRELQAGRMDNAIRILHTGFKYSKRHPFIKSQINAQIGVIYYVKKDFDKAFEFLKNSFIKHWIAQGMLAVIYMKRFDKTLMQETFEKSTKANPKEAFLWNLYAYCMAKIGKQDEAINILLKAKKKNPLDDKIENNLKALRNNDKMKMKNYGDLWYQFHLEKIPASKRQKIANVKGKRKMF